MGVSKKETDGVGWNGFVGGSGWGSAGPEGPA